MNKTFDLFSLPIYCQLKPYDETRKENMNNIKYNLPNLVLRSYQNNPTLSGYANGAISHASIILEHLSKDVFEPFILIEDDCKLYPPGSKRYNFEYPADTDAIWIGISSHAVHPTENICCNDLQLSQNKNFPYLFHDRNMLSTHGIFFASRKYTYFYLKTLLETFHNNYYVWDVPIARSKSNFNIYAIDKPIFYQDSSIGGDEVPTKIEIKH